MELRMSRKERDRLKVVAAVAEGRLKQREAAAMGAKKETRAFVRVSSQDFGLHLCAVRMSWNQPTLKWGASRRPRASRRSGPAFHRRMWLPK